MRVLLVTMGSHGDINPFIAIARALRERGHEALLATNPFFRAQIEEAGVAFQPIGEPLDLRRIGEDFPDAMHPRRGPKVVIEALVGRFAAQCLRELAPLLRGGSFDAVVHHHIAAGAAWAADGAQVARASVVLAPMMWMATGDDLCTSAWMPQRPGRLLHWLTHATLRPALWWLVDRVLNRVRREAGLPSERAEYYRLTRGGVVNLGMWSPQLRGPCTGDPETGVICGFAWHDRHGEHEDPKCTLSEFLAAGEAPILFSLGTAAVHVAGDFYDHAARACALLGRRGLLLIGPGRAPPVGMPAGSLAIAYARFSEVMPQCAVNVHHGGIGSTGQAMRAGRPMLVIPHAHDQFDNAARVARLEIGRSLQRPKVTAERLALQLRVLLEDPRAATESRAIAQRMAGEDGAAAAVRALEERLLTRVRTMRG